VNPCIPAEDDLHLSRSHPRANHRPMIRMDRSHARLIVVRRRNVLEIAYCAPSVWLCANTLACRYPSAACVHLSHLREGVAWVACLAALARVRVCVRAYEDTPHRLAGGRLARQPRHRVPPHPKQGSVGESVHGWANTAFCALLSPVFPQSLSSRISVIQMRGIVWITSHIERILGI